MPVKRKDPLEGFDPNKSDSDDENFDPSEFRPHRSKKPRTSRSQAPRPKRRNKYAGSDIDDDEDDVVSDSQEESFGGDDDEEDEEEMPVNAAGRRSRKAANKPISYADPDSGAEDDLIEGPEDEEVAPKQRKQTSRIVTLRNPSARKATKEPAASTNTRRTRAKTEDVDDDDFVELSTSGKHQVSARATSRSKSPEALSRQVRNMRAAKGVKQPVAATIEEAEYETSFQPEANNNENEDGAPQDEPQDDPGLIEDSDPEAAAAKKEDHESERALVEGDVPMQDADDAAHPQGQGADDEDTDDVPIGRRMTRSLRHSISGPGAQEEGEDEDVSARPRRASRLVRKGSSRAKNNGDDAGSDFEPNESGDDEASNAAEDDDGQDDSGGSSEQPTRGRKRNTNRKRQHDDESVDELELDPDEIAEEAEDLKRSSRSRSRRERQRRESTPIMYLEKRSRRNNGKPPPSYQLTLDPTAMGAEEDDDNVEAPPASQRKRAPASVKWQRSLIATYGPFGGAGGQGSLMGGPWGNGAMAAGGADSDSSDDEAGLKPSGVGGMVGMTPTSANAPGHLGAADMEKLGVGASPNVGKIKDRKALADADPLGVDMNVDFDKVGGLQNVVDSLKEMIQLPLLYPEAFQRLKITPPRGVLFHGPPGTGKTLVARALANSVSQGDRKVTFYMRKGADALSKWVGEAERQLRLLFEEARKNQPSIIFFDEIDGLAPVRSSKQEQIHASIVSTLLALMDGMDGRGQVIVIGATNRPDSVDPALRRPGRFDREFYFPLPDVEGRKAIIDIHTKDWGLSDEFKMGLAKKAKGYGGADLRALCTESALNAIQRTYPQIYSSSQKLVIDVKKINVTSTDFTISMQKIIPSSERSVSSGAAPLPADIVPLLGEQFSSIVKLLENKLPIKPKITALEEAMYEPYDDADHGFSREAMQQDFDRTRVFRPRLLITGENGMGQDYIASGILHHFERVHVQSFDLGAIHNDGRLPEQAIVSMFAEVKRHKPSVIFIPNIEIWYQSFGDRALTTLSTLLESVPRTDPILVLATTSCEEDKLDRHVLRELFGYSKDNRVKIERPSSDKRKEYFNNIATYVRKAPTDFPDPHTRKRRILEELPVAPPDPPKPKSKEEVRAERKRDYTALNQLKIHLQPVMDQIKKKYRAFHKPAIPTSAYEYLFDEASADHVTTDVALQRPYVISKDKEGTDVLTEVATGKYYYNLDTTVIEERISNGFYARPKDFFKDIKHLAHDIKNSGERDRILKANEMISNVDVDITQIEISHGTAVWEALYERQLQRHIESEEKRKKAAEEATGSAFVMSDLTNGQDDDSPNGPVSVGERVPPPLARTTAHFRVMSPFGGDQRADAPATNGDSLPSQPLQSGSDETQTTQAMSQMGPPQLPRSMHSQSLTTSVQATAGGTQRFSQVSAVTTLPPGVSPSALVNEASTTNEASGTHRSSSDWSVQAMNGYHTEMDLGGSQQLPDTQPPSSHPGSGPSQHTASSHSPWIHSQADAMALGRLENIGFGNDSNNAQTSPTSSQQPAATSSRMGLTNLLNNPTTSDNSSIRNSGGSAATTSSSQLPVVHEGKVEELICDIARGTSGCTVSQLEQINCELIKHLWASRHEWNRMKVLNDLAQKFNETIADIADIQGVGQSSQETDDLRAQDFYGSS